MFSPTAVVGYLAMFTAFGVLFVLVNLLIGKLVRPQLPNAEKLEIYECGEPTIGSSFVQFDLRFYVVALLFIIFDVEVAFFFPWAVVFGKATNLADPAMAKVAAQVTASASADQLTPATVALYRELGVEQPVIPNSEKSVDASPDVSAAVAHARAIENDARKIALFSLADIGAFFAVLMVGFAYVWRRGDLDWVRAVSRERAAQADRAPPLVEQTALLSS